MDTKELLIRKYETVIQQFVHLNHNAWTKAQFYFAIEAVFLAFTGTVLARELIDSSPMNVSLFLMLALAGFFNMYLCYVWFSGMRSNREWLTARVHRAVQIEVRLEQR